MRNHRAFSLVELLVVIGMIAAVAGLLIPAIARARVTAVNTACCSQLRQIAQACLSYSMDNNGAYPRLSKFDDAGQAGVWHSWGTYGTCCEMPPPPAAVVGSGLLVKHKYLTDWRLLLCPSRDVDTWPASYLVEFQAGNYTHAVGDGGGTAWPATCYVYRGFRTRQSKEWRTGALKPSQLLVMDMFHNANTVRGAHKGRYINAAAVDTSTRTITALQVLGAPDLATRIETWVGNPDDPVKDAQFFQLVDELERR
jgi:competence protein ComGC